MLRMVLAYGGIAGTVIIASMTLGIALDLESTGLGLWVGYLTMLAGLSLVFVCVKRYRDAAQGGVIRFATALGLGLGVSLVATAIYVIGWEFYLWATGYSFWGEYARAALDAKRAHGAGAAEIARLTAELAVEGERYANPFYRMTMTSFEILPVGVVVSVVSAALLRNSAFLPARAQPQGLRA